MVAQVKKQLILKYREKIQKLAVLELDIKQEQEFI